ncbi:MAG TPA: NUDIX domain-containing protein [Terriglobales bacterium]|jgi:8-oxo-dGTP pyrophosphatase MutT (NUDIX family)
MRATSIRNGHTRLAIRPAHRSGRQPASRNPQAKQHPVCVQVAAICYRITTRGLEFLLVKTRGGRWTFPKGGAEQGLTYSQTAALEAFEEAGVHGCIEEEPFAHYRGVQGAGNGRRSRGSCLTSAHLCEVLALTSPKESKRFPTWFSTGKAKRRLKDDRSREDGCELAQVVDRAVARIHRLRHETSLSADPLRQVQFESTQTLGFRRQMERAFYFHYLEGKKNGRLRLIP